jgi:hypothetical protein
MITVPILLGFDYGNPIGTLTIEKDKLPPGVDWCFSLGYLVKDAVYDDELECTVVTDYELKCVSIVADANYPKGHR